MLSLQNVNNQIDNKSKGFFCLNYRTLDSKNNIIIDVHVTFNNVRNSEPILKRLTYG